MNEKNENSSPMMEIIRDAFPGRSDEQIVPIGLIYGEYSAALSIITEAQRILTTARGHLFNGWALLMHSQALAKAGKDQKTIEAAADVRQPLSPRLETFPRRSVGPGSEGHHCTAAAAMRNPRTKPAKSKARRNRLGKSSFLTDSCISVKSEDLGSLSFHESVFEISEITGRS